MTPDQDMIVSEALKPCPFCGGSAIVVPVPSDMVADCTDVYVRCEACDATGPKILFERDTEQDDPHPEAIEAWNRCHPKEAGEAVAWPLDTEDQVEALARECGWNNRRYMTPADYSGWCEQMRKFARLASPSSPVSREPWRDTETVLPSPPEPAIPDVAMARHWIDRYAAGIDEEPQMDRIIAAHKETGK